VIGKILQKCLEPRIAEGKRGSRSIRAGIRGLYPGISGNPHKIVTLVKQRKSDISVLFACVVCVANLLR